MVNTETIWILAWYSNGRFVSGCQMVVWKPDWKKPAYGPKGLVFEWSAKWLYHLNTKHPNYPVFRCSVFRWLLYIDDVIPWSELTKTSFLLTFRFFWRTLMTIRGKGSTSTSGLRGLSFRISSSWSLNANNHWRSRELYLDEEGSFINANNWILCLPVLGLLGVDLAVYLNH